MIALLIFWLVLASPAAAARTSPNSPLRRALPPNPRVTVNGYHAKRAIINLEKHALVARQSVSSATSTSSSVAKTSTTLTARTTITSTSVVAASTTTVAATSTTSSIVYSASPVPSGYQIPTSFDTTLGTNFTSTACPSFLATMVADPELNQECVPFSLLLSTSSGFFQAEKSPDSLLPYILDASCAAPNDTCSALAASYASKIQQSSACGADLAQGNSLARSALDGLNNYVMMRQAGCNRHPETGQYCFAHAASLPNATELYFYHLAEGTALPKGVTIPCGSVCTRQLLELFSEYAGNSTLEISKTYASTWNLASQACGNTFAPVVTAVQASSDGHRTILPPRSHAIFLSLGITLAISTLSL